MAFKYGHKATSLNGVMVYLQTKYPNSYLVKSLKDDIPADQKHRIFNLEGINNFMQEYRLIKGSTPSKCIQKNAQYIQNNFKQFAEYCKLKLK